jgi:5-methylcytosine-specific restriction endonuclease McrA
MLANIPEEAWLLTYERHRLLKLNWRKEAFEADPICKICGIEMQNEYMSSNRVTLDHIIPKSKGGEDSEENWQIMCHDCNVNKGDILP